MHIAFAAPVAALHTDTASAAVPTASPPVWPGCWSASGWARSSGGPRPRFDNSTTRVCSRISRQAAATEPCRAIVRARLAGRRGVATAGSVAPPCGELCEQAADLGSIFDRLDTCRVKWRQLRNRRRITASRVALSMPTSSWCAKAHHPRLADRSKDRRGCRPASA